MSTVYSMTGFARVEKQNSHYQLVWEIKSVNQRFLETSFRIPDSLRGIEQPLREKARKAIARGKLDATLHLVEYHHGLSLTVNDNLLDTLLKNAKLIAMKAPDATPISQDQLLAWPGVLLSTDAGQEDIADSATRLFDEGLEQLIASRALEGGKLQRIISANLNAIKSQLTQLAPVASALPDLQRSRLQERVDELVTKIDTERIAQEVALLAQKADIREELDRLNINVEQGLSLINGSGPHGRRLDFLSQELNREANTLGAKSICRETSDASIELKVIIEQIREQVQNIE